MKNVCFLNSVRFWGGGEKLHLEYALAFKKRGYNVILASNKKAPLYGKGGERGLRLHHIEVGNLSFLNPFKTGKLIRFFQKEEIDTVIFSSSQDAKFAGFAAKRAAVKKIVYLRGLATPIKGGKINGKLFRYALTDVVANSEETKRTILQNLGSWIPESKVAVIYHGIELSDYESKPGDLLPEIAEQGRGLILGNAGRLTAQKGQRHLIDVAKKLKQNGVDFTLFIAGTGELEEDLKQAIISNQLENEVKLLGFVENVDLFMNSLDVFLLSSLWEGFGYVAVEAMAKSKPVIAFDVTSNPEIIEDGKTGMLIPPIDTTKYSEEIIRLFKDPALRQHMGEAGRKRLEERFQLEERTDEFIDYLEG